MYEHMQIKQQPSQTANLHLCIYYISIIIMNELGPGLDVTTTEFIDILAVTTKYL